MTLAAHRACPLVRCCGDQASSCTPMHPLMGACHRRPCPAGAPSDSCPSARPGQPAQPAPTAAAGGRRSARQRCCAQPCSRPGVRTGRCCPGRAACAAPAPTLLRVACRGPAQAATPLTEHKLLCDQECASGLGSAPSQTLSSGVKIVDIRKGTGASPPAGLQVQTRASAAARSAFWQLRG